VKAEEGWIGRYEMTQIGLAIAGTGMVASVHAGALKEIPEARLVGVWSRTLEKAEKFAALHQASAYRNFEELLKNPKVHGVIICLPSGYHAEYGMKAAAFRKHVIVEKPIDITLAKAQDLIGHCRKYGVKLAVIFQNRFAPGAMRLKKALDQGVLGKLILGDAYVKWYRSPEYYQRNNGEERSVSMEVAH
jgi:UDP-N-acetyl-2-amino-2-deoxyglucuronate dehydrogenase